MSSSPLLAHSIEARPVQGSQQLLVFRSPGQKSVLAFLFLALAITNCVFQMVWFWRYTAHNVNYDAISYIGIARHILDGDLHASLHGYWSPLISWLIAAAAVVNHQLLLSARIVTVLSFLACLPLVYLLSLRLWRSPAAAAFAVLWFTLARSVVAFSVYFIGADFLLTAATLGYFIFLLECLQRPTSANWLKLGTAHGVAFLAKAFAMPWLAIATLLSAFLLNLRNPKKMALSAVTALVIPMLVWTSWGMILKTRYGRFTAGYQSRWNLLSGDLKNGSEPGPSLGLADTSRSTDKYMVVDDMYPSSPLWKVKIGLSNVAPQIFSKERHNVPQALKEILILLTPGGFLAVLLVLRHLARQQRSTEAIWAMVVTFSTATLVLGYSMLVFDSRYVLPAAPLLISIAAGFLLPAINKANNSFLRILTSALFLANVIFLAFYPASPFRTFRRDYQTGVYATAAALKRIPVCDRLVVIGKGPFPEHGVGWEAGIYASYFSQCRIVGIRGDIPPLDKIGAVLADVSTLQANSILLLGENQGTNYAELVKALQMNSGFSFAQGLPETTKQQFGVLLWK